MPRRRLLALAAGAVASLGILSTCGTVVDGSDPPAVATPAAPAEVVAQPTKPRPNVLLITIDTLRADQLGSYGQHLVQTPTLDAFASQGARFAWHIVQQPQTVPSHGSIFTGMYPSSSGLRVQLTDKLSDQLETAATVYSREGYATAAIFSYQIFDPGNCNFQRGFDVYSDLAAGIPARQPGDIVKSPAPQTTDAAISQLQAFEDRPFFFWLHYFDPHCPYEPPGAYATRYDPTYQGTLNGGMNTVDAILAGKLHPKGADLHHLLALYQGEISYLDHDLGRLFAALDQLGLGDNTVVAITGDHGESFAEHKDFITSGDIFHPCSLYNSEVRVPLLLRFPSRVRPGSVVYTPTRAIDIFPTLLDLTDLPPVSQVQGKSLLPLLDGSEDGNGRVAFSAMPDYVFTTAVAPGWKLIQNNATGQRHLFALGSDPDETTDVLRAYPDMAAQLTDQLHRWMVAEKISRA